MKEEYVPSEYGNLQPVPNEPLAFAAVISSKQIEKSVLLDDFPKTPKDFLRKFL